MSSNVTSLYGVSLLASPLTALAIAWQSAWVVASDIQPDTAQPTDTLIITGEEQGPSSLTEVDLEAYTGFAQVLDRSDFGDRLVSFGDLLNRAPGIQINQSGGLGSYQTVSIRGSTGKQVNLFLDGMLLTSPASGVSDIQYIPSVLIETVTAYPDFTPVELGNANLAGAINFVSRRHLPDDSHGEFSTAYGSFDTYKNEVSAWGAFNEWKLIGGLALLNTENNYPLDQASRDEMRTPYDERLNNAYDQQTLFLKAARDWQNLRLNTLFQWADSNKQIPTTSNLQRDNAEIQNTSYRLQAVLDYQWGDWQFAHRIQVLQEDERFLDTNSTVGLNPNDVSTELAGIGMYSVASTTINRHDLSLGLDLKYDEVDVFDDVQEHQVFLADRQSVIIAAGDDWHLTQDWQLTAIFRQYWIDNEVKEFLARLEAPTEQHQGQSFQLGSRWHLNQAFSLKGNLGVVIRVPTMYEQFGWQGQFEGSPDITKEKSETVDFGFVVDTAKVQWTSSVYLHQISDAILTLYDSRGTGRAENAGAFDKVGVDSKLIWTPAPWFESSLHVSLLDSDNQSIQKDAVGKKIPNIFHQTYGAGIVLKSLRYRYAIDVLRQQEKFFNTANTVPADDKTLVSSSFTLYLPQLTFDLTGQNLLGENYKDFNQMPMPGRSLTATLTLSF